MKMNLHLVACAQFYDQFTLVKLSKPNLEPKILCSRFAFA